MQCFVLTTSTAKEFTVTEAPSSGMGSEECPLSGSSPGGIQNEAALTLPMSFSPLRLKNESSSTFWPLRQSFRQRSAHNWEAAIESLGTGKVQAPRAAICLAAWVPTPHTSKGDEHAVRPSSFSLPCWPFHVAFPFLSGIRLEVALDGTRLDLWFLWPTHFASLQAPSGFFLSPSSFLWNFHR